MIVLVVDIFGRKMSGFKLVLGQWMLTTHYGGKVYVPRPKANWRRKISFGGIGKGKIIGIGKIGIPSLAFTDKVLYVEGMKYNLLSISQFCESGYIVSFNKYQCVVKTKDDMYFFTTKWPNNLYGIDLIGLRKPNVTCLLSSKDER